MKRVVADGQLAAARGERENLRAALSTTRRIGAAIGILMSRYGVIRGQGFALAPRAVSVTTSRSDSGRTSPLHRRSGHGPQRQILRNGRVRHSP